MSIAAVDGVHDVEHKLGYAKGYAAGRKKTEQEVARCDAHMAEKHRQYLARRDAVFCAALQGVLGGSRNWTMNSKAVSDADNYVELAHYFTRRALAKLGD